MLTAIILHSCHIIILQEDDLVGVLNDSRGIRGKVVLNLLAIAGVQVEVREGTGPL